MKTLITKPQADFSGSENKSSVITAEAVLRKNLPQDKTTKTRTNKSLFTLLLQLLIINCSLLIATATADATIRYVSPHGSNEPPYTSWATSAHSIQSCIDISSSGDTIYVGNGVYKEKVVMIPGLSLIGAGWDSCIIDTRTLVHPSFWALTMADSCFLEGFQIIVSYAKIGGGIYTQAQYGIVHNNLVRNTGWSAALSASSIELSSNLFIDTRDGILLHGFSVPSEPKILNNVIDVSKFGIFFDFGPSIKLKLYNNTIILNEDFAIGFSGNFTDTVKSFNNLIIVNFTGNNSHVKGIANANVTSFTINNFINGNYEHGIGVGENNVIKNNVTIKGRNGISFSGSNSVVNYNNSWSNINDYRNFTPDSTNLSVDPMVLSEDSLDFRLQMYSPLIDAGDPDILDVDSSRSDIGLYGGPYGMSYQYIDLPPRPPRNVIAVLDSVDITIKWNKNTEADFRHYNIYRDTTAGFPTNSTTIVMSLGDTFYNHIIPPGINNYYYKLTAVDNQRNESPPSEEVAVNISSMTINDYPLTINDYILYQNYPNPFNPSTRIAYRLKEGGYVKLYVYDIKGELVDILVNQHQERGYYEVEFHTGVRSKQTEDRIGLASGIYIYQIMVRSNNNIPVFTEMKKMLYLK